jgi:uncharacterized protein YraI
MPVNSRINKAGLSTVQKNQLRRALNEKVAIQVVASDITSAASTNTTLVDIRASGTGPSYCESDRPGWPNDWEFS